MSNKKIVFRADGNSKTGLGHLYRLFALIEMVKIDYEFTFVTKEDSVFNVIPEGYPVKTIPSTISINEEANWLAAQFKPVDYIIIADGYQFVSLYQKAIKDKGYFLMYIDDLTTEYMYADIVVNHSPYVKINDFKAENYTQFALGTNYAMLRPSFLEAAKTERIIEKIDTVFICFGGSDFYDLTLKATKAILEFDEIKEINIVLGAAYKHSSIFSLAEDNDKIKLFKNLDEIALSSLMKRCSLGIVPSSTINFEICSIKMLVFGGYYIDNQINIYRGFKEKGIIYEIGDFNKLSELNFKEEILRILSDSKENHQKYINKQMALFDGKQSERFLKLINKLEC